MNSCYYVRPLDNAAVYRCYPGPWQVWRETAPGEYEWVSDVASKPSGEDIDRILNATNDTAENLANGEASRSNSSPNTGKNKNESPQKGALWQNSSSFSKRFRSNFVNKFQLARLFFSPSSFNPLFSQPSFRLSTMSSLFLLYCALLIVMLVGFVGAFVPALPGIGLIVVAILVWTLATGGAIR